jgi:anti-sigma-K factor RskA
MSASTPNPDRDARPPTEMAGDDDRLQDLLADLALGDLADDDRAELERRLAQHGGRVPDYDAVVAATQLAMLSEPLQAIPSELAERVRRDSKLFFKSESDARVLTVSASRSSARAADDAPNVLARIGPSDRDGKSWPRAWMLAAAACVGALLMLVGLGSANGWPWASDELADRPEQASASAEDLAARRAALVDDPTARLVAWTSTDDPAGRGVSGDVVWSDARQAGYMRFTGLAINAPELSQYQLWIFDATRDERYPVDGGVFNIDCTGEAIVRIAPRVPVHQAVMFAVTIEQPGGVVVSDRKRLPVLARVAARDAKSGA